MIILILDQCLPITLAITRLHHLLRGRHLGTGTYLANCGCAMMRAGNFIESSAVRSSSGKYFQEGLEPRKIDEYLIGWNKEVK